MLDPIGENDCVSAEAYKKDEVLNSKSLNEVVDISFKYFHEYPLHSYFEEQFESMQGGYNSNDLPMVG